MALLAQDGPETAAEPRLYLAESLSQTSRIVIQCSHGHEWEVPAGWQLGITSIVCPDGEDVLAAAGFVVERSPSFVFDARSAGA